MILARELPSHVLRERVNARRLDRIGRGVYTTTAADAAPDSIALARLAGLHHRLTAAHCFSHESAALLHGLPLWLRSSVSHVYQHSAPSSRRDPRVIRHRPMPSPHDVAVVRGLPATSLSRTVWDCLTSMRPVGGLVVLDAALRAGLDRDQLLSRAVTQAGARGSAKARALIALGDAGSESPGESACRFAVLRDGFPPPQTQVEVATRLGTFWADLGWPGWRVLLEYDGRSKYVGREAEEFFREKRRQDAIVEAGWRALHVTSEDLRRHGALTRRLVPLIPPDAARSLRRRSELGA